MDAYNKMSKSERSRRRMGWSVWEIVSLLLGCGEGLVCVWYLLHLQTHTFVNQCCCWLKKSQRNLLFLTWHFWSLYSRLTLVQPAVWKSFGPWLWHDLASVRTSNQSGCDRRPSLTKLGLQSGKNMENMITRLWCATLGSWWWGSSFFK